ncbi:Endonuclease, Uma2 family (restriction endonuclease fold) [Methylobacterium sp. ap11]|jgi:Uma2 family endonuclease|uniref:Uma2 family endonuclease n=1 Tax=Methylobacterium sp. ap11 TaxID=1761799 RepID=UPI0008AE94C6|nr:Uma2 family endonuclease [Methylobacterium sp. ap11]SEP22239.1 Endonuclease, Uma2 family (restriction endonuclease fold) [Methylobacterium sp. ap11]
MAEAAPRWATYADLEAVPDHLVAEIVDGVLETHAHTLPRLGATLAALAGELGLPFSRGRGGPGGWIFMPRTEFHFGRQVLVPDYAGWRRGRLSIDPDAAFIETSPDWVCEILSPATARLDRGRKRRIYAEAGVNHLWLLDPWNGVLEGFALTGGRWLLLETVVRGGTVTLLPFDAVSFPLDDLFPFDDPAAPPPAET